MFQYGLIASGFAVFLWMHAAIASAQSFEGVLPKTGSPEPHRVTPPTQELLPSLIPEESATEADRLPVAPKIVRFSSTKGPNYRIPFEERWPERYGVSRSEPVQNSISGIKFVAKSFYVPLHAMRDPVVGWKAYHSQKVRSPRH